MKRLLLFSLCAIVCCSMKAEMTFPLQDVVIRQALLVENTRFKPVPKGQEEEVDWSGPIQKDVRKEWPEVKLPHRWDQNLRQVGWYRFDVQRPKEWTGDLVLCLLASKFATDVFVNGDYQQLHHGGYTPVFIPLGEGDSFEVLLRVDNRLREDTVPKTRVGWQTFGGLDREVWLMEVPPARPEALDVRTSPAEDGNWTLTFQAEWVGDAQEVTLSLLEEDMPKGQVTLTPADRVLQGQFEVEAPRLWHPEDPFRHQLVLTWGEERFSFPIGIRELTWTDRQLLVNGKPVWLLGFGQHESEWDTNQPLTREERERDVRTMKSLFRIKAIRAGHYPNHPHLYQLADELGILVFTEIPAWQNKGETLARNDVWEMWLEPQLTGMVRTLRNHPSIFAWGVLNETAAPAYMIRAREHLESLDSTRRVAAVLDKTRDMQASRRTNLVARNLHYGWYHSKSVYDLPRGIDINLEPVPYGYVTDT